jgi:spore cortex formation protein SpoVR/YcgB (stage V sporulation)
MHDFEEETVIALKILFDKVKTLRHITIREMLVPETYHLYEENLQATFDALTTVEDAIASVGMKLEYEHWRLGGAVEELTPLMLHIPSASEKVMELVEDKLQSTDWPMERAEPLSE